MDSGRRDFAKRLTAAWAGAMVALAAVVVGSSSPATATQRTLDAQPEAQPQQNVNVQRLGGPDRYATAVEVSQAFFPDGAPAVFVATGFDFPDSLAAGPAAQLLGGPVLLTRPTALPAVTSGEIERLGPQQIYVAGSSAVVSDQVLEQLSAMAPDGATRVAGPDRYATAAAISEAFFPTASVAYIATGHDFPDALASGAAAVEHDGVLLLVEPDVIPPETRAELERLTPPTIVIAGSSAVVSASVEQELAAYGNVVRRGGADRYETAALISQGAFPDGASSAFIATGFDYPDALSAAPAPGGPVLLTRPTWMPPSVSDELVRLNPQNVYLIGSEAVVSDGVGAEIEALLGDEPPPTPAPCTAGNKPPADAQELFHTIPGATNQVALTFDMNGPTAPSLELMQYLIEAQVCTTIFPDGTFSQMPEGQQVLSIVAQNPDIFELGNHTLNHCNLLDGSPLEPACFDGPAPDSVVISELLEAEDVIEPQAGMPLAPYWRPPYGAFDQGILNAAAEAGYTKTFMWDIDTQDWVHPDEGGPTATQMADLVINNAEPGSIVLMHTGGWVTPEAVPMMVEGLRDRGFVVTSLSDMLAGD